MAWTVLREEQQNGKHKTKVPADPLTICARPRRRLQLCMQRTLSLLRTVHGLQAGCLSLLHGSALGILLYVHYPMIHKVQGRHAWVQALAPQHSALGQSAQPSPPPGAQVLESASNAAYQALQVFPDAALYMGRPQRVQPARARRRSAPAPPKAAPSADW